MSFRASSLPHAAAIFNIRTLYMGHDTVQHDAFEYDADRFLASPPSLRDSPVSHMMSGLVFLHDDATFLIWGDLVASLVEAALPYSLRLRTRGIRFNIEFHVRHGEVSSSAGNADGCGSTGVAKLKRLKYDEGGFKERDCAICYEDYESEGQDLTQMPCLHSFHYECVARWLKMNPSCPLCRQPID